jgi:hypothetical protein
LGSAQLGSGEPRSHRRTTAAMTTHDRQINTLAQKRRCSAYRQSRCHISECQCPRNMPPATSRPASALVIACVHEARPGRHRADRATGSRSDGSDTDLAFGAVCRCRRTRRAARRRARLGLCARQRAWCHPARWPARSLAVRPSARARCIARAEAKRSTSGDWTVAQEAPASDEGTVDPL